MTGPVTTYNDTITGNIVDQIDRYRELADRDVMARSIATLKARGAYEPNEHVNEAEFPPLTVAEHLEMLALGERIARYYRHPSQVDQAVRAGASWEQIAAATGTTEDAARFAYREWAEGQHKYAGMDDAAYAAAVKAAGISGEDGASRERPARLVQGPCHGPGPRRAGGGGADAGVHPGRRAAHRLRPPSRPAGLHGADPAGGGRRGGEDHHPGREARLLAAAGPPDLPAPDDHLQRPRQEAEAMTGPEHWEEADLILSGDPCEYGCPHSGCAHEMRQIARAQVHAALALAEAYVAGATMRTEDRDEWGSRYRAPAGA